MLCRNNKLTVDGIIDHMCLLSLNGSVSIIYTVLFCYIEQLEHIHRFKYIEQNEICFENVKCFLFPNIYYS